MNRHFQNPTIHIGDVFDVSGFGQGNIPIIRDEGPTVVQVFLVSEESSMEYFERINAENAARHNAWAARNRQILNDLMFPSCCESFIMFPPSGMPTGLRAASPGLRQLFASGSIRNMPIINIRNILRQNGFTQSITMKGAGYLFRNAAGEEVRVMMRGGGWDVRVRNASGNYLDEFGNVGSPASTHGITVTSK